MDWNPVWSRGFSFFNVSIFQYIFHQFFISTIPITAMGCRQCLSLSVVQLKGKHCRKPHCRNGVVDTFRQSPVPKMRFREYGLTRWCPGLGGADSKFLHDYVSGTYFRGEKFMEFYHKILCLFEKRKDFQSSAYEQYGVFCPFGLEILGLIGLASSLGSQSEHVRCFGKQCWSIQFVPEEGI